MTFLQQTLGKNYKWWYIFKYQFKYDYSRGNAIFHWIFSNLFQSFSFVFLWSYVVKNNDLAIYALVGSMFTRITGSWIAWDIADSIRGGGITKILMCTTSHFKYRFFVSFARPMFESSLLILILLIAGKIFLGISINPINFLQCIPFVVFGSFMNYCLNSLIGYIGFWEENIGSLVGALNGIFPILSGGFIPLIVLPFYEYFKYNPFAYLVHAPTQIYLGKYSTTEIIYTFIGGIAWCFVLWILARIIFKLGLKRNEAVGL
jgi:ABC-2 type transport system permease protein